MTELNENSTHITFWKGSHPVEAKILKWAQDSTGEIAAVAVNPFTKERLLIGIDPIYLLPFVIARSPK